MESKQINRLREEQLLAIEQTNIRIDQLTKFKDDYEALRDTLKTLPEKVTHDVMVPFGDLAFMPCQLVHTNEILVLLGDNWFVDRSASQAGDIVSRRIKAIDDQIKNMEMQKGLIEPRLQYTSELAGIAQGQGDVTEITEEYDEEKEKLWREQHKKSVQRYHQQLRDEAETSRSVQEIDEQMSDQQVWKRLEELERQEQRRQEMQQDILSEDDDEENCESDTDESNDEEVDESTKKKVKWKDTYDHTKHRNRCNIITFKHSSVEAAANTHGGDNIESPADIYHHFVENKVPTSILKSPSVDFPHLEPEVEKSRHTVLPTASEAFTGSIVERAVQPSGNIESVDAVTHQEIPRKVSQFRSRQKDASEVTEQSKGRTMQPEHSNIEVESVPKKVSKFKSQRQQIQR